MKLAITSDWQLQADSLDSMWKFSRWLLRYCIKNKVTHLLHLGDLKHVYNPLDVRALNLALKILDSFISRDIVWYQLKGNHDRISMGDDSGHWLPALRAAGAKTITKPKLVQTSTVQLAFLPYLSDPLALKHAAKHVSTQLNDTLPALCLFHNTIYGCKANVSYRLKEGIALEDLAPDKYDYCVGGHIHLPQKIGSNAYFVGSPVAHDWGEINCKKRILIYDSDTRKLTSVLSPLPGMYDPSFPGFEDSKPNSWKGCKVRIHVPCDTKIDLQKTILKAKSKAEAKYKGAAITVIPEFPEEDSKVKKLSSTDDIAALKDYIGSTCPEHLQKYKLKLRAYLEYVLGKNGFIRRASQRIRFLEAEGRNYLNFKKVRIDFRYKGILLITGVNKDWPKRNNGVGKTSLMNLPIVALTGKTLKGQSNDKWIRRNSKGMAWAKLRLRLQDTRNCSISRVRRPTKLVLVVSDKNRSSGIGTRGTQQAIEHITGLTWECIRNAIYVDQAEINSILSGRSGDRKSIFSSLLNLERFELARKFLSNELSKVLKLKAHTEDAILFSKDEVKQLSDIISDTDAREDIKKYRLKLSANKNTRKNLLSKIKFLKHKRKLKQRKIDTLSQKCTLQLKELDTHRDTLLEVRGAYKKDIEAFELVEDKCPTCKQGVDSKFKKRRMQALKGGLQLLAKKLSVVDTTYDSVDKTLKAANKIIGRFDRKIELREATLYRREKAIVALEKTLEHHTKKDKMRRKYERRLRKESRKIFILKKMIKGLNKDIAFLQYGIQCFSKDGMPAYLIANMIPQLNLVAEKYSKLMAEDEIKVKFITDVEGGIDVQVDNAHGGELVEDQSRGEMRLASIITSFSVREVINPANILILDEPGEGLDQHNSKLFAQVLKEISHKFGCILLATHSPILLNELDGERKIMIEKRNGIARIVGVS